MPDQSRTDDSAEAIDDKQSRSLEFLELDTEISSFESHLRLNPLTKDPVVLFESKDTQEPLFKIFFRKKSPEKGSAESGTETVTCRLCDMKITLQELERHTEWCTEFQDCLGRKNRYSGYLNAMVSRLQKDEDDEALLELVLKALEVDEVAGRNAAIRLAKLLYRITKYTPIEYQAHYKRLQYIVEQKKRLADRFAALNSVPTTLLASDHSPATDSSFDNSPIVAGRCGTPMERLTTMFATLLRRVGSLKRSHFLGSTPPRSSAVRDGAIQSIPRITDFEVIKPISKGAYGDIFLARKKSTQDLYAIKALRKSDLVRKNMISYVMAERKVMALAQAPFVVKLYYAFESADFLFLVMEYMIGGDMSSLIQEKGPLGESTAAFYTAQVVQALQFLHENGIIHRDIKPDNMLLDEEGHLKLSDFGLASLRHSTPEMSGSPLEEERLLGTPDYLAPEVLKDNSVGIAMDWWAVGVTLFEMLVGGPPFAGGTLEEIFGNILNFVRIDWSLHAESHLSEAAKDLVDRLLDPNPASRLSGPATLAHPFLATLPLSNLRSLPAPLRPTPKDDVDTSSFEARNRRYTDLGLTREFLSAEPAFNDFMNGSIGDLSSGASTPSRGIGRPSSPFDGFGFKNVGLLSKANRKLSSTPLPLHYSPLVEPETPPTDTTTESPVAM